MRVLVLHHVPHQPKVLQQWADMSKQQLDFIDCASAQCFPESQIFDGFIIMGGPMGVNDPLPWLAKEISYIEHLVTLNKPVLGICLGAQLIAKALGAEVRRMPEREIGWYPVQQVAKHSLPEKHQPKQGLFPHDSSTQALAPLQYDQSSKDLCLPQEFMPFHWHSDHFDLPKHAVHLYKSEACENQAFAIGEHILGLQFHLDFDVCTATRVAKFSEDQLRESGRFVQQLDDMTVCAERFNATNQLLFNLLDNFFRQ